MLEYSKWSQRNHKYYNFCICNNIDQEVLCIAWCRLVCFECGTVWMWNQLNTHKWHVLILWIFLLEKLFSLLEMLKAPIIAFVNIGRTWLLTDIVVFTWVTKTSAHYKCEGDLHLTAKTLQMQHREKKNVERFYLTVWRYSCVFGITATCGRNFSMTSLRQHNNNKIYVVSTNSCARVYV